MIVVLAASGAALVLLLALVWWRTRRGTIRRLHSVVARLDERPVDVHHRGGGSIDSALSRLERTTDRTNERLSELRLEQERLAAAIDGLDDAVIVANELGRTVYTNPPGEQFVGARHGDALVEDAVNDVLAGALRGTVLVRDVQVFGPPKRSLQVRGVPLADAGGAAGAAVVVRDVSSARRVESIRRDFVANVSHELKTPIGALIALSEALNDDDDIEVVQRLSRRVLHEAQRLGRIVDDLLDLSLIEAQESPEREPVPVRVLLEEAVDRLDAAAEASGVSIEVDDPPPDLLVPCDRRQVVSAVFNLLDNAVKYSEPGPSGEVAPVEVGTRVTDGRVVLWVRDRGVGIPGRDQERIFERFYRVDRARSRQSGGTGLGLAIVRHVAQAHGGAVWVESAEGEGSTFSLALPLAGRPASRADTGADTGGDTGADTGGPAGIGGDVR